MAAGKRGYWGYPQSGEARYLMIEEMRERNRVLGKIKKHLATLASATVADSGQKPARVIELVRVGPSRFE